MQSIQKYEEQVMREIMAFPREQLPQVARLLRHLRQDFAIEDRAEKAIRKKSTWEMELVKFGATLSSTSDFMAQKAAEKALER
jgi:hypothetical protein